MPDPRWGRKIDADPELDLTTWRCFDTTSFDRDAHNDNYCENEDGGRFVSDSEAVELDPTYSPGKAGHAWYNEQ